MRMIKFRAKETVLGKLTVNYGIGFIPTTCAYDLLVKEDLKTITVGRNTVKQFVGWDANNKEVYEEDILVDDKGNEYVASLEASLYSTSEAISRVWNPYTGKICRTSLKLKTGAGKK